MNLSGTSFNDKAVNRLTALWALNESGLGGVLHAAKFPFTGIFVGGFAVILICLIARYSNFSFKAILKATAMVLMIKAAVSPHSPLPAYIAVSFQGLLGAILFSMSRNFKITPVVFGALALLESAIQKILLTVLFFGMSFWKSLDNFITDTMKLVNMPSDFSFSHWLAFSYVFIYVLIGLLIGRFACKIPTLIAELDFSPIILNEHSAHIHKKKRTKKWSYLILIISILIALFLPFDLFDKYPVVQLLMRVLLFMLLFYYVVGPLTTKLIQLLSKGRSEEIAQMNEQIAELRVIVRPVISYVNKNYKGVNKLRMFVLYMIAITLNDINLSNG